MAIALVTNPPADLTFRSRAEACMAGGAESPTALQHCLRTDYPNVLVNDGIIERDTQRWYAYREGHWLRERDAGERRADGGRDAYQA